MYNGGIPDGSRGFFKVSFFFVGLPGGQQIKAYLKSFSYRVILSER